MILELNLVRTDTGEGTVYTLLNRKRVDIEPDQSIAIGKALEFLGENYGDLNSFVADKELVALVTTTSVMTVTEFLSARYLLNRYGLDILVTQVGVNEENPEGIDEGRIEFNVLDSANVELGFIPTSLKVTQSIDGESVAKVYRTIKESYNIFPDSIFGEENEFNKLLTELEKIDNIGLTPRSIILALGRVCSYVGKDVIVIYP